MMVEYGRKVQMRSSAASLRHKAHELLELADQYKAQSERHYAEYDKFYRLYMDVLDQVASREDEAYRLETLASDG